MALTVFRPATTPSRHDTRRAIPSEPDLTTLPVVAPKPSSIEKMIRTPATGLPSASRAITSGRISVAVPTTPAARVGEIAVRTVASRAGSTGLGTSSHEARTIAANPSRTYERTSRPGVDCRASDLARPGLDPIAGRTSIWAPQAGWSQHAEKP